MAESNWTVLDSSLAAADVARGVTAGETVPNGGGSFIFGYHSRSVITGAVGFKANQVDFNPLLNDSAIATGGSIRGAIRRGASASPVGFAPMFFIGLQGGPVGSVNDNAYMLGLSNNDPHAIILRKGSPAGGIPPTGTSNLRTSTATYLPDEWLHLRLDMIVNPNGDVVLKVFQSDLDVNPVTAPVWAAIPGMTDFIDDALGINSGSLPLVGGRVGMAFQCSDISRRAYFDHIQILRQK